MHFKFVDYSEMKLWELNEKKCIENIKMSNTIHRNIYVNFSKNLKHEYLKNFKC
jgi:hypothetical protein